MIRLPERDGEPHRVETLLQIPAAIRFISAEPLIEAIDFSPYLWGIHWVITGCERAKKGVRRIMDLDWNSRWATATGISRVGAVAAGLIDILVVAWELNDPRISSVTRVWEGISVSTEI